jgi:hypothetical protein
MRLYRINCDKEDAIAARLEAGIRFNERYQTRSGRKRAKVMAKDIDIARQYRSTLRLGARYWHEDGTESDPFDDTLD